jgi:hypothetical protein
MPPKASARSLVSCLFDWLVTVCDPHGVAELAALDQFHRCTEPIQSSQLAVARSVHAADAAVSER